MNNPLKFIIIILCIGVIACKKEAKTPPPIPQPISSEESAQMISGALSSGSDGFAAFSNDISNYSQLAYISNKGCGVARIDSVIRKSLPNAATTYYFKHKIISQLNCDDNHHPDNVTSDLSFTGFYENDKLLTTTAITSVTNVTGLIKTSPNYTMNVQYSSTGTFKLKADTTLNGTTIININLNNIVIAKFTPATQAIIDNGTGTVSINGNTKKGTFTYSGNITFEGNNKALIILDRTSYIVNLSTGTISKK
ncbi:hypothetical protein [Mucilaginibacter sp. dw_454]|uniref:hypothetical protein n=1 Tax=Mucilaginibacter sp. dw_454 TaxID=2720079 RepID=UPI001BD2B7C7|nr:hypothetical protein [Mucilaginibacter sp. dw_454]